MHHQVLSLQYVSETQSLYYQLSMSRNKSKTYYKSALLVQVLVVICLSETVAYILCFDKCLNVRGRNVTMSYNLE